MRAILLAAGKGTRLRPLTDTTPKPLIEVNGLPMIERQIQYLKEKGITEIIVVTGYLNKKFDYLAYEYGVKLVHNDKYDEYNNLYTMYLVRKYLQDAYVLEGDIYMHHNVIDTTVSESTYFSPIKYDFQDEWMLQIDETNRVTDIVVGSIPGSHIMCGVSYWSQTDGEFIQSKLEEAVANNTFKDKYWDNMIAENLDMLNIKVHELEESDLYEIDSLEDLENIHKVLQVI